MELEKPRRASIELLRITEWRDMVELTYTQGNQVKGGEYGSKRKQYLTLACGRDSKVCWRRKPVSRFRWHAVPAKAALYAQLLTAVRRISTS